MLFVFKGEFTYMFFVFLVNQREIQKYCDEVQCNHQYADGPGKSGDNAGKEADCQYLTGFTYDRPHEYSKVDRQMSDNEIELFIRPCQKHKPHGREKICKRCNNKGIEIKSVLPEKLRDIFSEFSFSVKNYHEAKASIVNLH